MPAEIIKLQDVWKIYQMGEVQVKALCGLSLSVRGGEFLSITGPSGSGKSTAMHMVGCLDIPTKGKVFLDGEDIADFSESELAVIRGRQVGFVFQTFNLIHTLTALENVMLPMTFQDVLTEEKFKRAKELLELVGLGHRLHHTPSQLSGGEQQRVAIARSLVNDPSIVLADEPTGNLDTKSGHNIMKLLDRINKKGKTVVIVTHEADIADYADRVVSLRDGQLVRDRVRRKKKI